MNFKNNQIGISNKDLDSFRDLDYYLNKTKDFKSSFGPFNIIVDNGFNIIDESKVCPVGYKARAGEYFISKLKDQGVKEIVYVQPRRGFAGISLSWLCDKYDMDLTLIMPASKLISDHQALCIQLGAKPLFIRIAAMPNANNAAMKYAKENNAYYIPLGLAHEDVVAGGVQAFYNHLTEYNIERMWTVISTGVLTRSLQIALPTTEFVSVAVARNIQHGELGRADFISYHKPFNSLSDLIPDKFDCEPSYDSKGYDYMRKFGKSGDWFFSVAGKADQPNIDKTKIDSYRDWKEPLR